MKVLEVVSIILGTRNLGQIFPFKQIFLDNHLFKKFGQVWGYQLSTSVKIGRQKGVKMV